MSRLFAPLISLITALCVILPTTVAAQEYRLRSGDTIRFEVLEDPSLNRALLVAPDGRVNAPLAGTVQAAGRTVVAVQSDLAERLAPNFATTPNVYVALESQRVRQAPFPDQPAPTMDVFVVGEANGAGLVEVREDATVLQLIAQMGGFTRFAATKRLQLRRGGETIVMNYKSIEDGTSELGSLRLVEGDVLVVPQRRLFE